MSLVGLYGMFGGKEHLRKKVVTRAYGRVKLELVQPWW